MGPLAKEHRLAQARLTAATHLCANLCGDLTRGHEPHHRQDSPPSDSPRPMAARTAVGSPGRVGPGLCADTH